MITSRLNQSFYQSLELLADRKREKVEKNFEYFLYDCNLSKSILFQKYQKNFPHFTFLEQFP